MDGLPPWAIDFHSFKVSAASWRSPSSSMQRLTRLDRRRQQKAWEKLTWLDFTQRRKEETSFAPFPSCQTTQMIKCFRIKNTRVFQHHLLRWRAYMVRNTRVVYLCPSWHTFRRFWNILNSAIMKKCNRQVLHFLNSNHKTYEQVKSQTGMK